MTALSDLRYRPEWVRPLDWLPLPDIQPPTEGIAALVAVSEDGYSNLVSLYMAISDSATWTVDWGDGSTPEVIASGGKATHDYAWADVGDVTSEGWRQAVLTVYPAPGKAFATINLVAPVADGVRNTGWVSPIIDATISASVASNIIIGDTATRSGMSARLEKLALRAVGQLNCIPILRYCRALQECTAPSYSTLPTGTFASAFSSMSRIPAWAFEIPFSGNLRSLFHSSYGPRADVTLDFNGRTVTDSWGLFMYSGAVDALVFSGSQNVTFGRDMFHSSTISAFTSDTLSGEIANAFNNAPNLREVNVANASGITVATTLFAGCKALEKVILTGLTIGVSIANCNLSAAALDAFFTSLGTANGAQTITITGNPGAATCDTSIATAKGWTVAN